MPIPASQYVISTAFPHSELGTEIGQAWFRFRFAAIYFLGYFAYITVSGHQVARAASASVTAYLLFSLFWLLPLSRGVLQSRWGRLVSITGDHGIISIALYLLGDLLAPVIWAPITVSIGNGLRYGSQYTKFSITIGTTFVGAALLFSPLWTAPAILTFGILFGIVVVSWYATALSEHLARERNALTHKTVQLEAAAKRDLLTGVANRAGFEKVLNTLLATPQRIAMGTCALLAIDLDGFKEVNDRYGHQAGDELLKKIADALVRSSRDTACIARFGGDEFCILVPDARGRAGLERYASRLLEAVAAESATNDSSYGVTASIGVYVIAEDNHLSTQALIERADALMYDAKKAGKNRFCIRGVRGYTAQSKPCGH